MLTGQKVWTSFAHYANWCTVLARTDAAAPGRARAARETWQKMAELALELQGAYAALGRAASGRWTISPNTSSGYRSPGGTRRDPRRQERVHMDGLAAIVWNLITETSGAPKAVWAALLEHIRTDPAILLDAWDELADLGADAKPHAKAHITQARQLVTDVLHAIGGAAADRGRDLRPVARGLVVLTAREIAEYKRGRRSTSHPPRRGRPPRRG